MSYTVLNDNGVTVEDISLFVKDYVTTGKVVALADTHNLYTGYYKPFKQLFIEFAVANTNANVLTVEYYNGTAWTALTAVDETEGFIKSGFILFDRPTDWAETEVDSISKFYIRIRPSVSHSVTTEIKGLGILLSNDLDLIGIKENIVSKLNNGNSWVGKHEAARKYIIQKLRNLGYRKYIPADEDSPLLVASSKASATYFSDLTEYDLHEPFELREASKFYALSFIYLDELSDEQDDKYERSGRRHEQRADEAVNLFMLKLDYNDNGTEDEDETMGSTRTVLSWA